MQGPRGSTGVQALPNNGQSGGEVIPRLEHVDAGRRRIEALAAGEPVGAAHGAGPVERQGRAVFAGGIVAENALVRVQSDRTKADAAAATALSMRLAHAFDHAHNDDLEAAAAGLVDIVSAYLGEG